MTTPHALLPAQPIPPTPEPHLRLVREADPVTRLTPREREVLALMAQGHGNRRICEMLFVGPKTVERHVQQIFLKLELPPEDARHRRVCAVLHWLQSPLSLRSI